MDTDITYIHARTHSVLFCLHAADGRSTVTPFGSEADREGPGVGRASWRGETQPVRHSRQNTHRKVEGTHQAELPGDTCQPPSRQAYWCFASLVLASCCGSRRPFCRACTSALTYMVVGKLGCAARLPGIFRCLGVAGPKPGLSCFPKSHTTMPAQVGSALRGFVAAASVSSIRYAAEASLVFPSPLPRTSWGI